MQIQVGETWGKRQSTGSVTVYLVLKSDRRGKVTLQNLKMPTSIIETKGDKLESDGYFRVSDTPYVNLSSKRSVRTPIDKIARCPRTIDIFEGRADSEFPSIPQIQPELF
ncbi:uncharacterized protein NMK_0060 [Novimethylophilus kurashikiensis]|uniref:Uncharacterized protein n=1 Tax=Novimethylophilus kurashikiensis TaxID=1825523 RepID=A0A2R5F2Y5_9PROT|nr:hypothetical protein [Novimethylophilus kurashikiensis]GBG12529.1 uncharacterized protein NMK_0060 [Novimethylophilus kurashikiensis]